MRLLLTLLTAALLTLTATACSGGDSDDPPAQPQSAPEQTAAQPEPQQETQPAPEPQAQSRQQQQAQPEPQQREPADEPQAEARQQTQQPQQEAAPAPLTLGGDRPARLLLPSGHDLSQPRPLVLLLHGYGSSAREAEQYFGFSLFVDEYGFGLLLPNGNIDPAGNRFWNGTDECCDIYGAEPDDVGYLTALIEEARTHANFDQVFSVGHSNGGFMSYRLACEAVPGLAAVVSLAGMPHSDPGDCRNPNPLSVLHIHGDQDFDVLYDGGRLPNHPDPARAPAPGAGETVLRWAERAGCNLEAFETLARIDTDTNVDGAETHVKRVIEDCADGVVIELWTLQGGGHIPYVWGTEFTPGILNWLGNLYFGEITPAVETIPIGGERSAVLLAPGQRGADPIPLIISLHGYGGDAEAHDAYFGLSSRIAEYGFALLTPEGLADSRGNQFWNGTDYCCDLEANGVDDHAWISSLAAEAKQALNIGPVYAVGYSNGGFMAYRLACDGLDGLAAVVSLAGSSFADPDRCNAAAPVSVLQIHGTNDDSILYEGNLDHGYDASHPGAVELLQRWGARAGCDPDQIETLESIDLDRTLNERETTIQRLGAGCREGVTIELWTIQGGSHAPAFNEAWPDRLLKWLFYESRRPG